jgi:hypothetical protein
MELLQKLALNAQQIDVEKVQTELAPLVIENEKGESAFMIMRGQITCTNPINHGR